MKYIITLLFTIIIYYQCNACRCAKPSLRKGFKESGIVASVTVLEILPSIFVIDTIVQVKDTIFRQRLLVSPKRVLINIVFKGEKLADTMIIQGLHFCELYLEVGKSYIIYGDLLKNYISSDICTRSGLAENHQDLAYLEYKRIGGWKTFLKWAVNSI